MDLIDALTGAPRSGEVIAAELGVSRAAVSKAAKGLLEDGFPVVVDHGQGYALAPGTPTPPALLRVRADTQEPGSLGDPYVYLGRTASTQDAVRELAAKGAPQGYVVLAEVQTDGRGRRGRAWESASGTSLTFSVLLRPALPVASLGLISLAAGIAVADAVGHGATVKWPNDVLAPDGRKLAGILAESQTSGEVVDVVILGLGINVTGEAPAGGAAVEELVPGILRVELLAVVLGELERWCHVAVEDPEALLTTWVERSSMIGQIVTATGPGTDSGSQIRGVATGLDPTGALIIRTEDARVDVVVHAGDVTLAPDQRTKGHA